MFLFLLFQQIFLFFVFLLSLYPINYEYHDQYLLVLLFSLLSSVVVLGQSESFSFSYYLVNSVVLAVFVGLVALYSHLNFVVLHYFADLVVLHYPVSFVVLDFFLILLFFFLQFCYPITHGYQ